MRADKRLGQHFLIDSSAVRRIVAALDPRTGDAVLEIGPGHGALTGALISLTGRLAAVELDARLGRELRARFGRDGLLLIEGDVLGVSFADVLAQLRRTPRERLRVAGNLPYNISKPVAMKLVDERRWIERAVLMFQREAADRLTAAPGSRSYGPLTVLCGRVYRITCLFPLAPGAFRPRPKVESAVTHWERTGAHPVGDDELSALKRCLRACFARRRQTLRNNLRAAFGSADQADAVLQRGAVDGGLRPEAVDPAGYTRLARAWPTL